MAYMSLQEVRTTRSEYVMLLLEAISQFTEVILTLSTHWSGPRMESELFQQAVMVQCKCGMLCPESMYSLFINAMYSNFKQPFSATCPVIRLISRPIWGQGTDLCEVALEALGGSG